MEGNKSDNPWIMLGIRRSVRARIRDAGLRWSPLAGRRLTHGDVITAAIAVADAHHDELAAHLTEHGEEESTDHATSTAA